MESRPPAAWRGYALWVARTLGAKYGTPRLGNPTAPFDDLLYVLLSQKTTLEKARTAYQSLRRQYHPWGKLLQAQKSELQEDLRPIGLWRKRARDIQGIACALQAQFGRVTLNPLRDWSARDAYSFLVSLPGVGEKTAKCVMLYTLGHDVSPVDVNSYRVLSRIGLLPPDASVEEAHRLLDNRLPTRIAYQLHVTLVTHGRTTCKPQPRCGECPLMDRCAFWGNL